MTAEVTIRPYAESDLEAVIAVMRDLVTSELELYDRTRPPQEWGAGDIEDFRKETERSRGEMLVAELNGVVVGYCNLHTHRNTKGDQDEIFYEYSYIGDLGVLARCRSMGIGARLIEHCEGIVRASGIKWMRLNVLAANTRGREFYAAQGFEECQILLEKPL